MVQQNQSPERSGNKIEGAMWDEGTRMINAQNQSPVVTDEELIAALRDAADWHAGRHVAHLATQSADRLEALTASRAQSVTEGMVERATRAWRNAVRDAPDEDVDERRDRAIRSALEAAQLHARPKVKALEWEELTSPREDGTSEPTGDIEAQTLIGEYSVCFDDDEDVSATPWCVWSPVENIGHFADFYEAKAAAYADYEQCILSALEGEGE